MSTREQATAAALENQAFALMSRLHVVLRRRNGRITDIEYMRIDPAYCRHVLDLAARDADADLRTICGKLHEIYFGQDGLFMRTPPKPPLVTRLAAEAQPAQPALPAAAHREEEADRSYVGRLR